MAKKTATQPTSAPTAPVAAKQQPAPQATNHTLVYRRAHPGNRVSYGILGVPGLVGFDLRMFADGKPPASIVLDCALALPVAKVGKEKSATA